MGRKTKTFLYLILGIIVLITLAQLVTIITKNLELKEYTFKLGIWGYLFLTLGIAVGGIFIPMTSLPFLLAGLALYGFWPTFIIFYIGNTVIAPAVDYWIAKKYGRPIVAKITGKKVLVQIDKISAVVGVKILTLLRILGGILFDSVSYAVGLTSMNFMTYFILTLTLPIPGMLITLYLLNKGITDNPIFLAIIVIWGYSAGIYCSYLIYKENLKINK